MDNNLNIRYEILKKINELIKDECYKINGCFFELTEESLLNNAGLDSFGYILFWLSIEQEYKFTKENNIDFVNNIDYKTYTIKDLIDRIEECL